MLVASDSGWLADNPAIGQYRVGGLIHRYHCLFLVGFASNLWTSRIIHQIDTMEGDRL